MHKKPILAETNRKQKVPNKIPGVFNSRPKSSHAIQYAEKAIQHDNSPIKSQSKEKKLATPKTKFTTRDRSAEFCSSTSSRLKSFPAEEIKRIQCSPRAEIFPSSFQRPEHPKQQLLSHEIIHGTGDGLLNHFPPSNAIFLNNQHHLSHPECRQTRPEVIIPSSYLRSAETQPHRPFVPIPRASHVKGPQVTTSLIINPGPSNADDDFKVEKKQTVSEFPQVQETDKKIDKIIKEVECEKQPVGGRNALLHRLKHMTEKKKTESSQNNVYDNHIKNNQIIHQKSQQIQNDGYPPRRLATQIKKPKEKIYQFTPAMIHDQELLIAKMRQQGVKEDIMKRQFDALLNEQKRQLMYLQQLEEPEEEIEEEILPVRRRITKNEEDEKPEWMAHITPPRISYATFEKMNQSTMKNPKQKNNKNVRFNDEQKHVELRNEELHPFSSKNGLQNINHHFYPNAQQLMGQNMMTRTTDGQQYCNCHHCVANYQNYSIRQHQEVPYDNNMYNSMQHFAQPQQNFPVWPNNYIINNDSKQCYDMNNFINVNTNIPHDHFPQNYSDEGPEKNNKTDFKRNNGLQDDESIKKAMEELKNRRNHEGYEYLANLNKTDKRLVLNGIQDPEDELMKNFRFHQQPTENDEEVKKEPRANGLENRRNSNNPPPPPNLHMKNFNEPFREYPRRKDELSTENYHYVPPKNMMDGNLLSIDGKEYQLILPAQKNIYDDSRRNSFMAQVYQVQGQTAGPYDYQSGYQLIRSNSMPCDINSHRHQCQGNPPNTQEIKISGNHCNDGQRNLNSDLNDNKHPNSYNLNNELINPNNLSNFQGVYQMIKPRIIGGIKYFARKFNYAPNLNNCFYSMDNRILDNPVVCNDKNCNE
ncbi:uncharacterized protein [Chelonus insularis]|uniref:uncharacterized protein isoform X2 n=1 Tax=Chelonus insularis TaxID=460826 RepID=UPI00158D9F10|nr:uncharacterized protein LOC118068501 isoform X2 [Chelonus insularis]